MKPLDIMIGVGALAVLFGGKKTMQSEREKQWTPVLTAAALKNGIPPQILINIARTESQFNPDALGPVTRYGRAVGMMQIMPSQHPGVNAAEPITAINYAAGYLAQLYRKFKAWPDAVAAYNAGPGTWASVKAGRIPAPRETLDYIKKVMG